MVMRGLIEAEEHEQTRMEIAVLVFIQGRDAQTKAVTHLIF